MRCVHRGSGKVWLPRLDNSITVPHPVCGRCGSVKNVTSDRGRGLGYYVNVLYEIKRYLEKRRGKLTEAQIRLITKRLEEVDGFEDVYWIRGSTQKSMFTRAVTEYTGLSCSFVESFL
jgi:hypothetical protein